jgi:hypothetical protein
MILPDLTVGLNEANRTYIAVIAMAVCHEDRSYARGYPPDTKRWDN